MQKLHQIKNIKVTETNLILEIDQKNHSFLLKDISSILAKATLEELNNYTISPSGYGISWPSLDEDLSVDGLLGIKHKPDFKKRKIAS